MPYTFSAISLSISLIAALHSAETFFNITDVSKSAICDGGLWSEEDNISLDITVNVIGQKDPEATFLLEAEEQGNQYRKQMCLILLLPSNCGTGSRDICYCRSVKGGLFRIKFNSVASISYNDNVLWVNKRIMVNTKLPTIYKDDVPVSVAFNGRMVPILSSSCTFHIRSNLLVDVAFCVSGLNGQVLTIYRDDVVDVTERSDCITRTYPAPHSPQVFKFAFSDKCRHRDFFQCVVDPHTKLTISENIMKTSTETTEIHIKEAISVSDYLIENSYLLIVLISSVGFMIAIFSLTCCYLKLQSRYRFFSTDSERSARLTFQEKLLYKSSVQRSLSNFLGKIAGLSVLTDTSRDPLAVASTSSPVDVATKSRSHRDVVIEGTSV